MKFTKVQRIEFLLDEIKEILHTIDVPNTSASMSVSQTSEPPNTSVSQMSEAQIRSIPTTSTRSTGGSSSSGGKTPAEICVRCFNGWEALINAGSFDLPGCEFEAEGRKRKKCEYCSSRRSECIKVPLAIRKPVQRGIAALERAVASGDTRKIQKKQRRLTHAYFCAHGMVKKNYPAARESVEETERS
ncbi:hypothetical protein N7516_010863 [Penicillium verrucosum]|uniref:uncharacterized protein n=1 Tax=Penicillium verrucosum TaxID=60171 RepID=UPI002544FA40|nr:uncharacterized protein N7516_010863 [Penicillium verrucosum]KAJ5920005.1 hypothetical protein N7516_010863 [Penicillium verrucosum]